MRLRLYEIISKQIKFLNEVTFNPPTIFSNNKRCEIFSFVKNTNIDRLTVGVKDNNEDLGLGSEDPCGRLNTESDPWSIRSPTGAGYQMASALTPSLIFQRAAFFAF